MDHLVLARIGLRRAKPAGDIAGIVQQEEDAGPLNSSEAEEDAGVGFEEIAEETKGQVGDHEELEGVAGLPSLKVL
jgi:hypothetical protein